MFGRNCGTIRRQFVRCTEATKRKKEEEKKGLSLVTEPAAMRTTPKALKESISTDCVVPVAKANE